MIRPVSITIPVKATPVHNCFKGSPIYAVRTCSCIFVFILLLGRLIHLYPADIAGSAILGRKFAAQILLVGMMLLFVR